MTASRDYLLREREKNDLALVPRAPGDLDLDLERERDLLDAELERPLLLLREPLLLLLRRRLTKPKIRSQRKMFSLAFFTFSGTARDCVTESVGGSGCERSVFGLSIEISC